MKNSGTGRACFFWFDAFSLREPVPIPHHVRGRLSLENAMTTQQALARFWQALDDPAINEPCTFVAAGWRQSGTDSAALGRLPKNTPKTATLAAKKTQPTCRSAGEASKVWNYERFRR
jgi:hypothetical protein